jgi:hypothetical protein
MNDDITPTRVITEGVRWLPAVVWCLVVVIGLGAIVVAVLWRMGVWFQNQAPNLQYNRTVNSQGYQKTLIQRMADTFGDVTDTAITRQGEPSNSPIQATLRASQLNSLRQFCLAASQLSSVSQKLPGAMVSEVAANCAGSTVLADPVAARPIPNVPSQ